MSDTRIGVRFRYTVRWRDIDVIPWFVRNPYLLVALFILVLLSDCRDTFFYHVQALNMVPCSFERLWGPVGLFCPSCLITLKWVHSDFTLLPDRTVAIMFVNYLCKRVECQRCQRCSLEEKKHWCWYQDRIFNFFPWTEFLGRAFKIFRMRKCYGCYIRK